MQQMYPLTWLFTAVTADGKVWEQTPEDRSVTHPEIILTSETDRQVIVPPEDPEWERLDRALRQGAPTLFFAGEAWTWRTYSAKADLADYIARGEVTDFLLKSVTCPEESVFLYLKDDPESGHAAGDLLVGRRGGMTVKVPFSLPDRLWRVKGWVGYDPQFRPALSLVYERDVTCVGVPGAMVVTDVAYRVGWSADVLKETVRHVLEVR